MSSYIHMAIKSKNCQDTIATILVSAYPEMRFNKKQLWIMLEYYCHL